MPHPSFNIPVVYFSCLKITNPVSIWQKSLICELLIICTDCRKIQSKYVVVSSCTSTQRNETLTNCVTTPCMDMKTIGIPPCTGTPGQPQIRFPKKKDWLYPEEPGQHVLPQRCVLETVCFFVRLIVFNFFHKFKFEGGGIRIWRAYGIGQGRLIPYQDFIVKPQGPTGLVVNENFFPLKAARLHKTTTNSDGG